MMMHPFWRECAARLRGGLHGCSRALKAGAFAAACAILIAPRGASATSTPITLGAASNYGVLAGTADTVSVNGGFKLTGNVGVGQNSTVDLAGSNTINGGIYQDSNVTYPSTNSGSTTTSGYYTQSMTSAISAASTASANAGALAATSGLADQGGSIASSVTISALTNLSENVLDVSAVSLTNGTITFNDNGFKGAKYIINVTGNFSLSNVTVSATGGASAADIIFNVEGTGKTVSITGGTTLGTLLVPVSNVTVGGGGSLTGALMAGVNNAGKSTTLTEQSSGYNITTYAYVPRTSVPEPSSIALFGAGVAAVAAIRRKRSRRA